jgi:hypothetical protein
MTDIEITDHGLNLPPDLTLEQWLAIGEEKVQGALRIFNSTPYTVGDYMNYGEDRWPEAYAQAIQSGDYTESTLARWAYIARRVPLEVRKLCPTHTHAYKIARLTEGQQKKALKAAETQGMTVRQLAEYVDTQFPNEGEKRGRKPKVRLTFEEWSETYFSERGMTTESKDGDETYVAPEIIELMQSAWEAAKENK